MKRLEIKAVTEPGANPASLFSDSMIRLGERTSALLFASVWHQPILSDASTAPTAQKSGKVLFRLLRFEPPSLRVGHAALSALRN